MQDLEQFKHKKFPSIDSRYFQRNYPELYSYLMTHYTDSDSFSERLYRFQNNLDVRPVCRVCSSRVVFENRTVGYRKYCCRRCSNNDPNKKDLSRTSCLERYGVDNFSKTKEFNNIFKEKYYTIRSKTKKTNLERYGTENPMQNETVRSKTKKTNLERYGTENPMQNETVRQNFKESLLDTYGVDHYSKTKSFKEKIRSTSIEHYGVSHPFASSEIKSKIRQTNLERYGTENPMQNETVQSKAKKTNLERYGAENPFASSEIKSKIRQTNLERYGAESYSQTDNYKEHIKHIQSEIQKKSYETKKLNGTFNSSKIEKEFKDWLDSNNINYKYQYRSEEYPFNCDFYFPDKNLYLEIQGSWVHGHHPFDPESAQDQKTLQSWKDKHSDFYDNAIETWTIRDPKKRLWVKEHKLNWKEVFSTNLKEVLNIFLYEQ